MSNMGGTVRDSSHRPMSRGLTEDPGNKGMRPLSGGSSQQVDLSIVRDRDMIPDIPTTLQQTSKQYSVNTPNVFLPPVTINEYICQQKRI
jgi:hypothetical protein